jgi:hypothetical protein
MDRLKQGSSMAGVGLVLSQVAATMPEGVVKYALMAVSAILGGLGFYFKG